MARHADLHVGAEQRARFACVVVVLPEVYAVGAEPLGEARAVVDDEGDVVLGADRLERFGELRGGVLVDALYAELERRNRPGAERAAQTIGKAAADLERRDEVQLTRRTAHVAREGSGELRVERAERVFDVHRPALAAARGQ